MKDQLAFVGDIHGCLQVAQAMVEKLRSRGVESIIFLGDYINKGPDSRGVLEYLATLRNEGDDRVVLLRGNHEEEFLRALETGDLARFLKMGGAATVRSYIPGTVPADVWPALRSHVPDEHITLLRTLNTSFETNELLATHEPRGASGGRFRISGHRPVGSSPVVKDRYAHIDTGCGQPEGALTALLWPSRTLLQL